MVPAPQARPQAPQLALSTLVSTQLLPHMICPEGQTGPAGASVPPPVPASTGLPSPGGMLAIQRRRHSSSSALKAGPTGMRRPHSGVGSATLRKSWDSSGWPGTTSFSPRQPIEGAFSSRASRSGDTRSRPSAVMVGPWQPEAAQRAASTWACISAVPPGQTRFALTSVLAVPASV
jgi:hypothetical protein